MANIEAVRFGTRLRTLRKERGLTQEALARKAFVSRSYIAHLETGRNTPSWEVVGFLAQALDVTRAALDPDEVAPPSREQLALQFAQGVIEATITAGVAVSEIGRVPADTTRWAEWRDEGRMLPVPREWIGTRSPDDLFILVASGDCLMRRGIVSGMRVLVDPARKPRHDDIAIVRVADEYTMKVWHVEHDGRVTLRNGDDAVIVDVSATTEEVEVVGVVIASWWHTQG